MGSVRKRILPAEEKRMWLWIYNNLKKDNKDAYLSCGLQIWNQYIEYYGIKDRTADSYATRFRKIMKPSIITCQLKPSQIEFIIKKNKWNITPTQQLLLQKMLADEKSFEDGDVSGYISERSLNTTSMMKEERSIDDSGNECDPSTSEMTVKHEVVVKKELKITPSSRRSGRCSNKVTNYNEKFLSRRSCDSANSSASFNVSSAEITDNDNSIEEKIKVPVKLPRKRRACPSEVNKPVKKRIVSDVNNTPTSISIHIKEENEDELVVKDTVVKETILATTEANDFAKKVENINAPTEENESEVNEEITVAERNICSTTEKNVAEVDENDTVTEENILAKNEETLMEITENDTVINENTAEKIEAKVVLVENIILNATEVPIVDGGWDPTDDENSKSQKTSFTFPNDESVNEKENIPYSETPKSITVLSTETSKELNDFSSSSKSDETSNDDAKADVSTNSELNDSVADNKTTPIKIVIPSNSDKNVLLTPKSILSSGQRKQKDDGSAVRVRFKSPIKSAEENLTPKRTNIPFPPTPSTPDFSDIDTEILQILWHKVHGADVNDLSAADLVAFKKISLFKDLHMRIKNVQTFFRGRKPTLKATSNDDFS